MLPGKKNGYSIRWARNNRKKPDLYGLSLNPYKICLIWWDPRLYQPTYVSPPSIGSSYCNFDSLICPMRNAKRKKDPPAWNYILILLCPPTEMNWSIHRILGRDWRGSNPQLPPWQGGALTDWTTIPGKSIKLGVQPTNSYLYVYIFLFIIHILCPRT